MRRTVRRSWRNASVAVAMASGVLASDARADWSMPRHDAHRTGAASGSSNITTPGAYWRSYLGGRVGLSQGMPLVIGGETTQVYVSSGRVIAAPPNGLPVWSTENSSIVVLEGMADLDDDGAMELVAASESAVFVFDALTGALRWQDERVGAVGGVRVVDVDGDGVANVLVQGCGCCRINTTAPGFVIDFAQGFNSPRDVWALPFAFCGASRTLLVDDVDGNGTPDVLLGDSTDFKLLDGATGTVLATSPPLGTWIGLSWCESADLDQVPGKELVCVHGTPLDTTGPGHRVFALHYQGSPAELSVLWTHDVGERDEVLGIPADFLRDLDGDGTIELTVSGKLASGDPVTEILDAHTGEMLGSVAGEVAAGTAQVSDHAILVTTDHDRLRTWTFARGASPLTLNWTVSNRSPMITRDWVRAARQPLANRLLVGDVDLDGNTDLYTVNLKLPSEMPVHALTSSTGDIVGQFEGADGTAVLAGWKGEDGTVVVSTSDGLLTNLTPTLGTIGAVRASGYYSDGSWGNLTSTPVAADLDGDGAAEIAITDSRHAIRVFDARGATNAGPPRALWERWWTSGPSIIPGLGGGGTPGVACRGADPRVSPEIQTVAAVTRDGAVRWEAPIGAEIFNDVLAANIDGDAVPDLIVQWGEPDDTAVRTTALAGVDGQVLWTANTQAGVARFPAGAAVVDWNGDGIDDVVFHHYGTRVLSGVDGSEIAFGGPLTSYFMTTLVDVTGDTRPEVTLHGGFSPTETLTDDLAGVVWSSNDDDRPYPYAAVTSCPSGPVLVSGSLAHPSRLKVTLQAGTPGAWQSVVLSHGSLYLDESAAAAAGVSTDNQLTSVHIHEDLTGQGHPSVVVGSSDGWLYAVNPCTLTQDFVMPFDAAVGAVAFADSDADGLDEIIVSTADGYLHGIKQAPIPGPREVRDIDPTGGAADIDVIDSSTVLAASWDPVDGAIGYEVTVALDTGGIVTTPEWHRVLTTTVVFADVPLVDGQRYVVSVRALSVAGVSPDTLSDGVLVHIQPDSPDAGPSTGDDSPGEGSGCCSSSPVGGPGPLLLAIVVVVGTRRRRRR